MKSLYSVSELTYEVKALIEENFPLVWIYGEISNFHAHSSGHFYFTLKDEHAQISAVMFKGQNRQLKFIPQDGMTISGLGRINVYEPRGSYQIIFEIIQPKGAGELQKAFEQLKDKLEKEGLFDDKFKKKLPFIPFNIGIVTSPTGSVIHDIMQILNRRFPNLYVKIAPAKVQGIGAIEEIVSAIDIINSDNDCDIIILARGGGSIEDLAPFNSEPVARAIFNSNIPVISAVGHETDYTIADFTADLRAPTPSAAAEMAVPLKEELQYKISYLSAGLHNAMIRFIKELKTKLEGRSKRLVSPEKRLIDLRFKLDDLTERMVRAFKADISTKRERLLWRFDKLESLNPLNILSRGYSITRLAEDKKIVTDADSVKRGEKLEIILRRGVIYANRL